ncbi:MAG: hypothetical protein ABSF35_00150 [Polyangia bacterium]|jgi:hypothetical protein
MAEFLFVADQVSPVVDGELPACAAALALALSVAKHRVTILSLATPDQASRLPGMARRLRTVTTRVGGTDQESSLYEGRSAVSQCSLYVLGADSGNRGRRSALLASAATSLVRDQICWPDVVVGWGETSALALACAPSAHAALVVPDGRWNQPLSSDERADLDPDDPAVAVSNGVLVALGAIEADVVILPCPSAAEAFRGAAELACRASDQPVASMRFGCDELPHDPATDPALAATFSRESPSGKQECRKTLVRRTSLAVGPRTLLLATGPLDPPRGGREILDTISKLGRADVAVVFPAGGDRALIDQANVLAMGSPGKVTVFPELGLEAERQILAAADAVLLADAGDLTGRPASLALRYGALPLAPDAGANGDYLVDCDVTSQTGCSLLYAPADPWGGIGAIQRAAALRTNVDLWQPLLASLMRAAPRWSATAASLEAVCLTPIVA